MGIASFSRGVFAAATVLSFALAGCSGAPDAASASEVSAETSAACTIAADLLGTWRGTVGPLQSVEFTSDVVRRHGFGHALTFHAVIDTGVRCVRAPCPEASLDVTGTYAVNRWDSTVTLDSVGRPNATFGAILGTYAFDVTDGVLRLTKDSDGAVATFERPAPESTNVTVGDLEANPAAYDGKNVSVVGTPVLGGSICTAMACANSACCNACGSSFSIGKIALDDVSGEAFGCRGNSCDPTATCSPFEKNNAKAFTFAGTFHGQNGRARLTVSAFKAAPAPVCERAGCSSELCVAVGSPNVVSSCIYRPEFACYRAAPCEVQATGACGFTASETLTACLEGARN